MVYVRLDIQSWRIGGRGRATGHRGWKCLCVTNASATRIDRRQVNGLSRQPRSMAAFCNCGGATRRSSARFAARFCAPNDPTQFKPALDTERTRKVAGR